MDDAVAKGATVTVGGKKPDLPEPYNKVGVCTGAILQHLSCRTIVIKKNANRAFIRQTKERYIDSCPVVCSLQNKEVWLITCSDYLQGYFYAPTVLSNATIDMKIFREETFGPAMPLFRFKDDEEAIQLANNTEYGLAAYFFTKVPHLMLPILSPVSTLSAIAHVACVAVTSKLAVCCCNAPVQQGGRSQ